VKPIVFAPEAEAEFIAAVAHYEAQRAGLGLDLQREVENAAARIQHNALLCPLHKDTRFRKWVLRRFPYTIFYLDLEDCIWIAAVAHQKRRPGYWQNRTPE
jgi:toxin ParE1/3/4